MSDNKFIPLDFTRLSSEEMMQASRDFLNKIKSRRTVRTFSDEVPPIEIIENAITAAGSAPSGANMQPWHFVIVTDQDVKKRIRLEAEKEEKEFYSHRAPDDWLKALEPFQTNPHKPFLEKAPYLIVIFEKKYDLDENGQQIKHYYTKESVGIACGMLITALHFSGLVSLTHTPSPMNFLNEILDRPKNEKPYLILVAGYPEDETQVPNITKKKLNEIMSVF